MGKKKSDNDRNLSQKSYGSYLKVNREWWQIPESKLARGLCSSGLIDEVEKGRKGIKWLLRERLLRRTGVPDDAYERYLSGADYAEWILQEKVIDAFDEGDAEKMMAALTEYGEEYGLTDVHGDGKDDRKMGSKDQKAYENVTGRLRKQFYLAMRGMCRKLQKAKPEELSIIFAKALRLTVPDFEREELFCDLVLCAEEINLMLEYVQSLPAPQGIQRCRQIQKYLENARMEDDARVLNYPKAILVLCRMLWKKKDAGEWECGEILRLCGLAFALIRKTKRSYYLLELAEIEGEAKEYLRVKQMEREKSKRDGMKKVPAKPDMEEADTLKFLDLENNVNIRETLEELHIRFHVPKEQTDAYLYRRQDVYYIGDIIRTRRKLKGMTQRELCEGICHIDTLRDLEKGKKGKSTQPIYLQEICERLGLSPESVRTDLVTSSVQARRLEKQIRYGANDGKFQENLVQLKKLKTLIDMEEPINRQWVVRTEGMAKRKLEQITEEEYKAIVKQALGYTLPLSILELPDEQECYLTNSEMACIYHLSVPHYPENPDYAMKTMELVFRLEREFEEAGREKSHVRTYELYMLYMAGILDEQGEYEKTRQYTEKIIRLCLQIGRMNILDRALYEWMRSSYRLQRKMTEPEKKTYDWRKDLKSCLILSRFCQNSEEEQFYKKYWTR